ncbi:MAG TPA: hypothetical protein DCK98_11605 [Chloroflexi bacterium]|nr:hypothetical protein [Chloroflexota bacterium]HAL28156.1 hypothetical protein [Chloroflexota bacterium]
MHGVPGVRRSAHRRTATAIWLGLARALLRRRLWRVEVDGYSMAPTLVPGQIVWCESRPPIEDLRVGDIVVLGAPKRRPVEAGVDHASGEGIRRRADLSAPAPRLEHSPGDMELEIKRLSALPGQDASPQRPGPPSGYCEVLGDNPEQSAAARLFGPIPLRYIVARALLVPSPQPHQPVGGHPER